VHKATFGFRIILCPPTQIITAVYQRLGFYNWVMTDLDLTLSWCSAPD